MKLSKTLGKTGSGPEDWFTGSVFIDTITAPEGASQLMAGHVRFTPGARTAWHTHPRGQTLYVTDGVGLVARRDGAIEVMRPGDVVHIDPGEEHWHGATNDNFMAHVALNEVDENGSGVTWLEHVTDEEYEQQP